MYGTLERLLLPFGLHHILIIPMNYTALGGTPRYFNWCSKRHSSIWTRTTLACMVTDLCKTYEGTDASQYQTLLDTVHPARFKVGQMIGSFRYFDGCGCCYLP